VKAGDDYKLDTYILCNAVMIGDDGEETELEGSRPAEFEIIYSLDKDSE